MDEARKAFEPELASVRASRRFVREQLAQWGGEAFYEAASQLVTELATNSVIHARTPFVVELTWTADQLRLCVSDRSVRRPLPKPHSAEATTGRGLDLVVAFSDDWGVNLDPGGKTVWCELCAEAGPDGREPSGEPREEAILVDAAEAEPSADSGMGPAGYARTGPSAALLPPDALGLAA